MAYPVPDFLFRRALLLGAGAATLAGPARAGPGPGLLTGTVARFTLAATRKPLPDLPFVDADDRPARFAQFEGKVLLVNFWATWCAPCVKEMPSLDRLQAALGGERLAVLPLSLDGPSRPKVAPFYREKKLEHLGIWFDKGRRLMQALEVTILPTSILADAEGREIGRLEGEAEWDRPEALALVKAAIGAAG